MPRHTCRRIARAGRPRPTPTILAALHGLPARARQPRSSTPPVRRACGGIARTGRPWPTLTILAALHAAPSPAQEDAPPPPRILDDPPGQASLAELPANRTEALEEVVVVGSRPWRLPELGATWRAQYDRRPESRVAVRYLPLYDPELADRWPDLFQLNKQEERTGYIELFRIRFGAEARPTAVPTVLNPDP